METITYAGNSYPARTLAIKGYGERTVSTTILQNALLGADGVPVSPEAERIDDEIFFFLTEEEMELPDGELERFILESI